MRHLLVTLSVASTLSAGVGFAAAKFSEPESVLAKGDPNAKLLKQIQQNTAEANILLSDIAYSTSRTCQAVRESVTHTCERR
jgi:hypothetical protein